MNAEENPGINSQTTAALQAALRSLEYHALYGCADCATASAQIRIALTGNPDGAVANTPRP